jgi:hypothetical protein
MRRVHIKRVYQRVFRLTSVTDNTFTQKQKNRCICSGSFKSVHLKNENFHQVYRVIMHFLSNNSTTTPPPQLLETMVISV